LDVGNSARYPHTIEFQTWIPDQAKISDLRIAGQNASLGSLAQLAADTGIGLANKAGEFVNDGKNIFLPKSMEKEYVPIPGIDLGAADTTIPEWKMNGMAVTENMRWNGRSTDFVRRATASDLIAMYMPAGGWMDRISNQYAQQSMTAAMGTAGLVVEAGSGLLDEYKANGGEIPWGKVKDMLNGPQGMEVLGKMSGMAGMDAGVMTAAGLNAMGYALNPQFEMLYGGTDLREFQFEFTMTPRSQKEAETIRMIIKKFKYHASPAYTQGQGRYIIPPSYFDITFNFNGSESRWLPSISTCVLKSFDVDYTGGLDQWSTHADGSPIQVKMTLVFAELEMMHKKLRMRGY
jgi:hypothetical protein